MFGHTLLRFNKYPYRNKNPNSGDRLNSQAVSFAAEMKDIDAVRYAIYGLGGGFEGRFAISPYYLKVKEYALSENRDLWEYDLNLTQSQIFILTDHLWELYHVAKFDYYFLDENCAYILLAMLDATDESLNLTAKLGGLVTPADTIKALMSYKDLVKKVRHWPSDRKVLRQSISALTPDERILFNAVISHEADDMQDANAYVLDAVVNYQQFKKFANTGKLSARDNRLLKNALRERSRADNDDDRVVPPIDQSNRPDRGHDTRALKLSYVRAKQESSYELSGRLGYHDLMDSPVGFEPLNELKFLELGVRINSEDTESIAVSKFSLIDLVSLPPYHKYDWQFSWLVRSGYRDELAESRTFTTMAGGGLSFNLFTEKIVVYNLALAAVKDRFSASYDYSLGPTLLSGILTRFSPRHAIDLKLYRAFDYQIKRNMALDARTLFEFEEGLSILESWQIRQNIKWILKPGQEFRAQDQYEWSIGLQKYF
jgi:hypothetical protein